MGENRQKEFHCEVGLKCHQSYLVWSGAAACHLERLDKVQKRALSLIGAGTIIDSLALRRTVSALCLFVQAAERSSPNHAPNLCFLPNWHRWTTQEQDTSSARAIHFGSPLTCQCDQTQQLLGHSPMGISGPGTHFRRQCWRMPLPSKASRPSRSQGLQAFNQDKLALGHDPIITTPNHTMIVNF